MNVTLSDQNADRQELTVPHELHGKRVDIALARLFPRYSRSLLSEWLKQGLITVNRKQLKPKDKVLSGDVILFAVSDETLENQNPSCQPEAIPLNIVYEDESLLVINKPAGLIVHPGAGNPGHTLVNALLHHAPQLDRLPRAGIVHRLDKETTGLLIAGKTLPAYTDLVRQMQARDIQRQYITLVHGHVIGGGDIATLFGRHPKNRLKMAVLAQGKEAITHYSVRKHYHHFTLLNIRLLTGRTHQIRVHMAHINHPVVGDPLYGGKSRIAGGLDESLRRNVQAFERQALHAASLAFIHPETSKPLTLTAPLPDDFQHLLTLLDDYFG
ncbi:23S rRNA pseudouridine(1911/1915/1917) synthase RluD [Legionella spiritensis]|uniref:23S rRNA pseudouridine(1911/1915/1917) synthase RluD n=1 Tax=Legionella spiritensis TaxID=452 RepID=UPI000F705D49|nr:23S rRNA pseudouridine(1911/1915/1917) synthase RluD [Legionella spiritensis]VEG90325.1 uracil hydrolyase [Legionella spiritensis]